MTRLNTVAFALALTGSVQAQVLGGTTVESTATVVSVTTSSPSADATVVSVLQTLATTSATTSTGQAAASVVSIFFPGADELDYVGSVLGESNGVQTLAISCGPNIDADTCGFPSSVTVTAGPSTAYVSVSNQDATFIYDCKISASTKAICMETFNGDAEYIATSTGSAAGTGSTSSVITETLDSTDITWMPITITATGTVATGAGETTATSTPVAQSSQSASPDADNWSNLSDSGSLESSGSTSTATVSSVSASASTSASASASASATSAVATTSNAATASGTTAAIWSTTSAGVSAATYTGAAEKFAALGNYAAGLLALAGMAL